MSDEGVTCMQRQGDDVGGAAALREQVKPRNETLLIVHRLIIIIEELAETLPPLRFDADARNVLVYRFYSLCIYIVH